jgi:hypothetical protein
MSADRGGNITKKGRSYPYNEKFAFELGLQVMGRNDKTGVVEFSLMCYRRNTYCQCIFHPCYCATVYCPQSTASTRAYRVTALLEPTTVLV